MEELDFEKELNELMDLQDKIDELSNKIQQDMLVFGMAKILFPPKKDK